MVPCLIVKLLFRHDHGPCYICRDSRVFRFLRVFRQRCVGAANAPSCGRAAKATQTLGPSEEEDSAFPPSPLVNRIAHRGLLPFKLV